MPQLVLASSSPFRKALLEKLSHPFTTTSPDVDETPRPGELPQALVERLTEAKARAAAVHHAGPEADTLIIASDQVAVLDGKIMGKPGNHLRAAAQLRECSNRTVTFLTGLALLNIRSNRLQLTVEPFRVHFRPLSDGMIERYLRADTPYGCAGSFKAEGLGISLFERLEGDDPNTLVGLPLIRLIRMLEAEGISIP